ncbi:MULTISPECIES: hypothetical protein [unclassified Clostridium]|uniref:hypothetical protein n=1 Tax=unclassified Clostridium TaxID=2614128 RepID=UPI0002DBB78A|nr:MULTISPECIES: hypothetical protein [unclassified Clostridium]
MKKLSKIQKIIICCLILTIMFLLMGNSNNVPETFVERIFKPFTGKNWRFSYAGLIVIVGIYYCLKKFNEIRENSLIVTAFRRVIVTIVLMNLFSAMWVYCIQIYKGFFNDLNSIYIDREKTSVEFHGDKHKLIVKGKIDIVNCSNYTQKFQIKIKAPSLVKEDINEEYITLENEFEANPKEEEPLHINEELEFDRESHYSGYGSKAFEYILFNDKGEVVFKGTSEDYQTDELDS